MSGKYSQTNALALPFNWHVVQAWHWGPVLWKVLGIWLILAFTFGAIWAIVGWGSGPMDEEEYMRDYERRINRK